MMAKLKRWAFVNALVSGSLFALSGEWSSPIQWTFALGIAGLTLYAMTASTSDLMDERFHPPSRGRDPVALLWIRLSALAAVVVAPLDGSRFHWSPPIPEVVRLVGMLGALVAFAL